MSCFLEAWCTAWDFCVHFPWEELNQKSFLPSQFFLFWKKNWIYLNTLLNPSKWHTKCSPVKNPNSSMAPIWQSRLYGKGAKLHMDIWEKLLKKMVLSGKGFYCFCRASAERTPAPHSRQGLCLVWSKSWECNPALSHICDVTTGQSMQCDFLKLSCWANIH